MIHVVILLACALAIYFSCEWFVNAVEWLGQRLNLGSMAVGTVLAAFGTALPESVVALVAVTTGATADVRNIGVGAAMGGPLVLATVAYGVTGAMLLLRRRTRSREKVLVGVGAASLVARSVVEPDSTDPGAAWSIGSQTERLAHDQPWFLAVFVFKVALGLVVFAWKPWLGVAVPRGLRRLLSGARLAAASAERRREGELEPLKLRPHAMLPSTAPGPCCRRWARWAVIFFASQLFVHQLEAVGPWLGLSPQLVALLLSPIATELPEILNAVIWVRQGKTGWRSATSAAR